MSRNCPIAKTSPEAVAVNKIQLVDGKLRDTTRDEEIGLPSTQLGRRDGVPSRRQRPSPSREPSTSRNQPRSQQNKRVDKQEARSAHQRHCLRDTSPLQVETSSGRGEGPKDISCARRKDIAGALIVHGPSDPKHGSKAKNQKEKGKDMTSPQTCTSSSRTRQTCALRFASIALKKAEKKQKRNPTRASLPDSRATPKNKKKTIRRQERKKNTPHPSHRLPPPSPPPPPTGSAPTAACTPPRIARPPLVRADARQRRERPPLLLEGDAGPSYERAVLEGYDAADDVLRLDYAVECREPSPPRELLLKKLELDCVGECPPS
ncbi:hypothetical protein C8J57DRAFT_1226488 [Mycena rebaudengoi]|nr:hypothetical protein C8J57DRAFT_1226488 [Mycena rebaudengoi]